MQQNLRLRSKLAMTIREFLIYNHGIIIIIIIIITTIITTTTITTTIIIIVNKNNHFRIEFSIS